MAVSTVNPWAAGAVVFDTRPYAAFYERQMLRQQAKQDALDNYFRDLNKNITTAGMRSQDVPGLLKKQQEWQQIGMQKKAALLNPKLDNGQTLTEYQTKYNDMLAHINESKEAYKNKEQLGKLKFNKDFSYVFDDPNITKEIEQDDLPVGDPNRKRLDIASLTIPPKPLDVKEMDAYNKYLTGGVPHDKIPGQIENMGGFKTRTPIITQYSPENQRIIGQHAMNAYDTDRRWRYEADKTFKQLMVDPEMYKQFNTVYKSLYGNDIDSPKEAWAAKGILDNNMKATEFKEGTDDWGRMVAMQKIRQADAEKLVRLRKELDPNDAEMNNVWYETYLGNVINTAKQKGQLRHIYTSDGGSLGYYNMVQPDQFLMKAFSRRGNEPDKLGVTQSGEIIPIFYKYDDKKNQIKDKAGNPVIDLDDSQPMSYNQALVNLGYRGATKKQLGQDMQQVQKGAPSKQKSFTYDGKSYTRKQLNDMGYDDNEIEDYLKQGILK